MEQFKNKKKKDNMRSFILELSAVFTFTSQAKMGDITSVHQINAFPSPSTDGWGQGTSSGE